MLNSVFKQSPGETKRREVELGCHTAGRIVLLVSCSSTDVFVALLSTAQLKQQLARYTSCLALPGSGPHLLDIVVLTVGGRSLRS